MIECHEEHKFNKVEVMLHLVQSLITKAHDDGVLNIPAPILSRVYQTISRGFVNLLNAKKITDTRFPFPYAQLIAMLLLLHVVLTPLMMSSIISSKILAVAYTFVPVCGMFALNRIAIELENPFGTDENDLPMENFQTEMNQCLLMLLHTNTDMISWTSPHCIMDFEFLLEHQRKSHKAGKVTRLSDFGTMRYTNWDPLENMTASRSSFPRTTETTSARSTWFSSQSGRKSTSPLKLADTLSQSTSRQTTTTTTHVTTAPVAVPPEVAKGVEEFEKAFVDWMQSVEVQMGQLRQSFDGLKMVNEAATTMISEADFGNLSTNESGGGWEKAISPV